MTGDARKKAVLLYDLPAHQYRISQLEALQNNIRAEGIKLADKQIKAQTTLYRQIYSDGFDRKMYDIQRQAGMGFPFTPPSPQEVDNVLKQKFMGKHYSDRVWENTDTLVTKLDETIKTGLLRGASNSQMARRIKEDMNTGYYESLRLIRTESNRIAGEAALDSYEEAGIEKYQYLATLDEKTCESCGPLDGEKIPVKDAKVGENMHPMHPHCRCTTVSVTPDWWISSKQSTRMTHTPDGWKEVKDLTYKEWRANYRKDYGDEVFNARRKMALRESQDRKQYERYKDILGKNAPKTFSDFSFIKHNDIASYDKLKQSYLEKSQPKQVVFNYKLPTTENMQKVLDYTIIQGERGEIYRSLSDIEKEQVTIFFEELIKNNEFGMRVPEDKLGRIIDEHFMNQLETGTSGGTLAPQIRKDASYEMFGTENSTPDINYEKYGYLTQSGIEGYNKESIQVNQYGDIRVIFKKEEIIDRTTMYWGDSLARSTVGKEGIPTPVINPTAIASAPMVSSNAYSQVFNKEYMELYLADMNKKGAFDTFAFNQNGIKELGNMRRYFELQYHGMLTINDVQEIIITQPVYDNLRDDQVKILNMLGINVIIN